MRTVKLTVDADGFMDAMLAEILINRESENGRLAHVELDVTQPARVPESMARIVLSGALVERQQEAEIYQMIESIQDKRR